MKLAFMRPLYTTLLIVAVLAMTACHKDSTPVTLNLAKVDSGRTATVAQGSAIVLTLPTPSDGGYHFNPIIYNNDVLTLADHQHIAPITTLIGDGGKDVWSFTAHNAGTSAITVTATRTATETITIFSNQVVVK